jgi:hypothetical protein
MFLMENFMKTQSSSKPRLKNDTLGEEAFGDLCDLYAYFDSVNDLGHFKQICEDVVQKGGGNQTRKDQIIYGIKTARTREAALKKAQDFILAGMGLGV